MAWHLAKGIVSVLRNLRMDTNVVLGQIEDMMFLVANTILGQALWSVRSTEIKELELERKVTGVTQRPW